MARTATVMSELDRLTDEEYQRRLGREDQERRDLARGAAASQLAVQQQREREDAREAEAKSRAERVAAAAAKGCAICTCGCEVEGGELVLSRRRSADVGARKRLCEREFTCPKCKHSWRGDEFTAPRDDPAWQDLAVKLRRRGVLSA